MLTLRNILFAAFLLATAGVYGQHDTALIRKFRIKLAEATKDADREVLNDSLVNAVRSFLGTNGSFDTPLTGIPYLGDLLSPDGVFRLITWNLPYEDGTFRYFAFIQVNPENKPRYPFVELTDKSDEMQPSEFKSYTYDKWFGALYYSILPFKYKNKTAYLLLGWDGNTIASNKKVIETMLFDKYYRPRFGIPVIETAERHPKKRILFEYIKDGYMLLRYDPQLDMVVFSHLEPTKPQFEGIYAYYAPGLTYDGLRFKKGKWMLEENIEPKSEKTNRPYNDPKNIRLQRKK